MLDTLNTYLIAPFNEYGFMRRALISCIALGLGAGPVGVLLILRRMALVGEALSHAILPGAAIGFLIVGSLSLLAMGIGGLIVGLLVVMLSGFVTSKTILREDASFAGFYLFSLGLGVLIVSWDGSNVDLMHVLFGTILAIDAQALYLVGGIVSLVLTVIGFIYRPLVTVSFDPTFLQSVQGRGIVWHLLFMIMVVINLVAGFEALGTLMAVGMLVLPAVTASVWAKTLFPMFIIAFLNAAFCGFFGLLFSLHTGLASGPAIIVCLGIVYCLSLLLHKRAIFRFAVKTSKNKAFKKSIFTQSALVRLTGTTSILSVLWVMIFWAVDLP